MRTYVVITNDDQQHNEFKKGEEGYIEGFVQGADSRPYTVVVIEKRKAIVMLMHHQLKLL